MSIESRSRQYGKVFDHWQIKEFLGSGSGGKTAVFRLVRSDSTRGVSALKVVNLIEVRGDINNLSEFRRKEYETARDECSRNAEQEVWLMDDLRGNTNIVDYLDHTFVDWSDETGFGRDLLIRMELLKDLRSELQNGRSFSEREVLKIGSDICIALIRCHRKNILHRDIKPENIFRNKDGDYKLGDFGVSRVLDTCPGAVASTGIGTYEYWPAEQMTGRYDKRVDIYSLGLVLYELCNQNRLPFAASTYVTGKEVSLRLAGTPLPEPIEASLALSEVILKACAFDPEERYQNAEELLRALNRVIRSLQKTTEHKTAVRSASGVQKKTEYATVPAEASEAEIPADKYRTIPASVVEQKKRTSFSTEPVKKKTYTTEPAEKHVPKYVTRTSGSRNKSKLSVIWIAVALLGLCIVVFSAGLLFVNGSDKQTPDKYEETTPRETEKTAVAITVPIVTEETSPTQPILVEDLPEQTEGIEGTTNISQDPNHVEKVCISASHVIVLYEDGTVDQIARLPIYYGYIDRYNYTWDASKVSAWKNIVDISSDGTYIVGLQADGTVVAITDSQRGQAYERKGSAYDLSSWSDIIEIDTNNGIIVGLKSDGTVVCAGHNSSKIGDVSSLANVVDVEIGSGYLEYLLSDGSWKKYNADGEDELYGVYPELEKIYGTYYNSIGIMTNGTVVLARTKNLNSKSISQWTDIVDIAGDEYCLLGLKSDGTVCAVGVNNRHFQQNISHWTNMVSVCSNHLVTIGVKEDGTFLLSGDSERYGNLTVLNKMESVNSGTHGVIAHTDSGANVRSGPGTNYYQVTKLPSGTAVTILETRNVNNHEWGRMMFGWISMDYFEPN